MNFVEVPSHFCKCGHQLETYLDSEERMIYIKCHNGDCEHYDKIAVYRPDINTAFIYKHLANPTVSIRSVLNGEAELPGAQDARSSREAQGEFRQVCDSVQRMGATCEPRKPDRESRQCRTRSGNGILPDITA